jgi:hypothetical protein
MDKNSYPIIYINMQIDKKIADSIILNANKCLFSFNLYKYNDLKESSSAKKCVEGKFTYIIPDDANKNKDIDYNEATEKTAYGSTFRAISIGLIRLDHVEANKRTTELNLMDTDAITCARKITENCSNLVLEPFNNNKRFDSLTIKAQDSAKMALNYLNNQSVFYETPFRFYMDYKRSYLISSKGNSVKSSNDLCSSVSIRVRNIIADDANDEGYTMKNDNATINVSYASTQVYDNTISNKSHTEIRGITSSGVSSQRLQNRAEYEKKKVVNIRLNNDNDTMAKNIKADIDNSGFFFYFMKAGLDLDLITMNKKITVEHVNEYKKFNGKYLVYRLREIFIREDDSFALLTAVNLKCIGYDE